MGQTVDRPHISATPGGSAGPTFFLRLWGSMPQILQRIPNTRSSISPYRWAWRTVTVAETPVDN